MNYTIDRPVKTRSSVDLKELEECIIDFFNGTLDVVPDEYLQRLWMNANQLIPGHPLLSVIDQDTMREALGTLELDHRLVLKAYYGENQAAQTQLNQFSNSLGQNELRVEAIEALGIIIEDYL